MRKFDTTIGFDASKFTWDIGTGVADASELGLKPGQRPFTNVYNDACDQGMTLMNLKRGTSRDFILTEIIYNPEGETMGWKFNGVDINVTITIYND